MVEYFRTINRDKIFPTQFHMDFSHQFKPEIQLLDHIFHKTSTYSLSFRAITQTQGA